ncbi:MAG TPA: hypothetical protein VF403_15605, partial [Kofleriaceae bacterium]
MRVIALLAIAACGYSKLAELSDAGAAHDGKGNDASSHGKAIDAPHVFMDGPPNTSPLTVKN